MMNLFLKSLLAVLVLQTLFTTTASKPTKPAMDSVPTFNRTLDSVPTFNRTLDTAPAFTPIDGTRSKDQSNVIGAKCAEHRHCADISYCNIKMDEKIGECAMAWWFIMILVILSPFILIVAAGVLVAVAFVLFAIGLGIYCLGFWISDKWHESRNSNTDDVK
jgi:hypothetical protein